MATTEKIETESTSRAEAKKPLREIVFTPESPIRNPLALVREIFLDLFRGRELAWRLFLRNLSAQYRQTMFGFLWAFLPPLANTALWVGLNANSVINIAIPGDVPYYLFVLTAMVFWQLFVDAVSAPLLAATQSKPMLAKVRFPREAILVAAVGEVLFNFAIRLVLLLIVYLGFYGGLPLGAIYAPLGAIAILLMGIAIGVWLAPLGLLYDDIGRALPMITQFWMFVTPVIYPVIYPTKEVNAHFLIIWLNPPASLIEATRSWLIYGDTTVLFPFAVMTGIYVVILILGLIFYRLSMPILIERMSA